MIRIGVLITCHDRKDSTMLCLDKLDGVRCERKSTLEVYVVDDGSSDGTADLIRKKYPDVHLITGDGTLFWNRSMYLAFSEASKKDYDFYLWLNDDTYVFSSILCDLLSAWNDCCTRHKHDRNLIIGSTCDPVEKSKTTYGGIKTRKGYHPFRYDVITPTSEIQYADTMNGNIVLIPRSVYRTVGNLEPRYSHSMGDFDYGFRAKRLGCNLGVAPFFQGICRRNAAGESWRNQFLPLRKRIRILQSRKGLPFADWALFCFRNGGSLWPLWTVSPYAKLIFSEIIKRAR